MDPKWNDTPPQGFQFAHLSDLTVGNTIYTLDYFDETGGTERPIVKGLNINSVDVANVNERTLVILRYSADNLNGTLNLVRIDNPHEELFRTMNYPNPPVSQVASEFSGRLPIYVKIPLSGGRIRTRKIKRKNTKKKRKNRTNKSRRHRYRKK
jgi:hypothetical protein